MFYIYAKYTYNILKIQFWFTSMKCIHFIEANHWYTISQFFYTLYKVRTFIDNDKIDFKNLAIYLCKKSTFKYISRVIAFL